MDTEDLMAACNASVFKEPLVIAGKDRHYPLRKCDGYVIYQCLPPCTYAHKMPDGITDTFTNSPYFLRLPVRQEIGSTAVS